MVRLEVVRAVIDDLKEGFGVEDIAHRGSATQEQTREVLRVMREHNLTENFYRNQKRKRQCK
jgi:hypothetical protein